MKCAFTLSAALLALVVGDAAGQGQRPGANPMAVTGRVAKVQPDANRLTVKTEDGKEVTLVVDGSSRLQLGQQAARLNQLKEGQRVRVTYEQAAGKNRVRTLTDATESAAELNRKLRTTLESAKNFTYQQRDDYKQKVQTVLSEIDRRLEDLQARAAKASGRAKQELTEQIRELSKKSGVARQKLNEIGSTTAAAWDDFRAGVSRAVSDLGAAFERIYSRVKE